VRKNSPRKGLLYEDDEQNPLTGVANLFDVAMVFSVALMVALVMSYQLPELLTPNDDVTIVKNPGQDNMQIIIKEGQEIEVLNMTDQIGGGTGEAIGTTYKLADGSFIYVPDSDNKTGG
jgi:hypothetical protein